MCVCACVYIDPALYTTLAVPTNCIKWSQHKHVTLGLSQRKLARTDAVNRPEMAMYSARGSGWSRLHVLTTWSFPISPAQTRCRNWLRPGSNRLQRTDITDNLTHYTTTANITGSLPCIVLIEQIQLSETKHRKLKPKTSFGLSGTEYLGFEPLTKASDFAISGSGNSHDTTFEVNRVH